MCLNTEGKNLMKCFWPGKDGANNSIGTHMSMGKEKVQERNRDRETNRERERACARASERERERQYFTTVVCAKTVVSVTIL